MGDPLSRAAAPSGSGAPGGGDAVALRTMVPDDLDSVLVVERAAFPWTAWSRESFVGELAGVPATRWYAVAAVAGGERVVGHVGLLAPESDADSADVTTLAVDPAWRRRGIGSALLHGALTEAARRGAARVLLEVAVTNGAALTLYAAAGFTRAGLRPRYYAGPDGAGTVDALVLARTLPVAPGR